MGIKKTVEFLLKEIPKNVIIVGAVKSRRMDEIIKALKAGIQVIGENYVQEAEEAFAFIGRKARWHFIGHLQKNKVKKAVRIFDLIETVDSSSMAREIDKRCSSLKKIMSVLCEINIAKEEAKSGIDPGEIEALIREISSLQYVKVRGLMTMGPFMEAPEKIRPYFKKTKEIFEKVKSMHIPNVEMKYLSMGMSDSYQVAIEEGANIIRIGTKIFGTPGNDNT